MSLLGTEPASQQNALNNLQKMIEQGRSFSSGERDCCFLNTVGDGKFATISALTGMDFPEDGRAVSVVDWDQDGYPDLWISFRNAPRLRLMRNEMPHDNHYVALALQGNGTTTNRDAIGARVEVIAKGQGNRRLIRTVRAGEGFLGQSSKVLTIGLGDLAAIEKIKVRWPAGAEEEFSGVAVDGRYRIVQGSGKAVELPRRNGKLALAAKKQEPLPPYKFISAPLVAPLPMPRHISYQSFDGKTQRLGHGQGKPVLLILWASWCKPCQVELIELAKRASELQAAGIEVVALSVDGVGEDASTPEAAQAFCTSNRIPFAVGRASEELAQNLMAFHHMMLVLTKPLPIPVSFLIDGQGRMSVIYKGPVPVEELLRDAHRRPQKLVDWWREAACMPGTMLEHEGILGSLRHLQANTYYNLGTTLAKGDDLEAAAAHLRLAVATDDQYGEAHEALAGVLAGLDRETEAMTHYQQALKLVPQRPQLHLELGHFHVKRGRPAEAIASYKEALRLDPKFVAAQQSLDRLEAQLRGRR